MVKFSLAIVQIVDEVSFNHLLDFNSFGHVLCASVSYGGFGELYVVCLRGEQLSIN